jgi:cytochrome d ubiquinol oxidase subunit II
MEWYLALIWASILGVAVAMYVILDGFDLGLGILFPWTEDEHERDQMMNTVAPFWDGNETWLVLGGGGLLAAFPAAYAVLMPAAYLPVIFMLLGLIFRGVAFEFRWIGRSSKKYWNFAFAAGSILAAFSQGIILGTLVQGIKVENNAFVGGTFDWVTPFTLMCGLAVVTGYALLGATWLLIKTDGIVAERARAHAKYLFAAVVIFMGIVSLWTPLAFPRIAERWFTLPNFLFFSPVPIVAALVVLLGWWALNDPKREVLPFLCAIALFFLGYTGLVISNFPYLIPPSLTVWEAAAAPASQLFMLFGTLIMLPIILGYTGFIYWMFRGKVREGEGYH